MARFEITTTDVCEVDFTYTVDADDLDEAIAIAKSGDIIPKVGSPYSTEGHDNQWANYSWRKI